MDRKPAKMILGRFSPPPLAACARSRDRSRQARGPAATRISPSPRREPPASSRETAPPRAQGIPTLFPCLPLSPQQEVQPATCNVETHQESHPPSRIPPARGHEPPP